MRGQAHPPKNQTTGGPQKCGPFFLEDRGCKMADDFIFIDNSKMVLEEFEAACLRALERCRMQAAFLWVSWSARS